MRNLNIFSFLFVALVYSSCEYGMRNVLQGVQGSGRSIDSSLFG